MPQAIESDHMKLSNLFPPIKTESQTKTAAKKSPIQPGEGTAAPRAAGPDRVELSTGSLDVQKMKNILQETPPVRLEKIQALKEQIDRGEYQVDPYRVADKMLMDLLGEHLPSD